MNQQEADKIIDLHFETINIEEPGRFVADIKALVVEDERVGKTGRKLPDDFVCTKCGTLHKFV